MVARVLEQIECDVCGQEGTRYTLSFPDGIKVLDRCTEHDTTVQALREEVGDFTPLKASSQSTKRGAVVLTDITEITERRQPKKS